MRIQLVVGALFVALGARGFSRAEQIGDVEKGKRVFVTDGCYECHGYAAQGGRDGARLAQTTMPLPAFVRYVRRPAGAMPAFTQKVLSDQDLSDIYAFLKSLPAAKPSADIPMLKNSRER